MSNITDFLKKNYKGVSILFGGCLIHLVLGSFYLWGVINVYVTSYYRLHSDSNLKIELTSALFCVMLFGISIGFFFGLPFSKRFGFKITVTIETILVALSIFLSSYMNNFWLFMMFYGIFFGLLSGFLYIIPVFLGCQYFPNSKGVISGLITGAFGLATIFSSLIIQNIVNPNNEKANILYEGDKYFDYAIANNVPSAIRYLSLYFLCLGLIGSLLLFEPPNYVSRPSEAYSSINDPLVLKENTEKNTSKVMKIMKNHKIYIIFFMNLVSSGFGLMLAGNLKNYGMDEVENNDRFLTITGSIGAVFNGVGRLFWGLLYDKYNFKIVYSSLLIIQIIIISSLYYISKIKILFFIWSCLGLLCEGGHFALFPALCLKEYGIENGSKVYPFVYFSFSWSNFFQFGIVFLWKNQIGWENIFWIYLGLSLCSLIVLWTIFRENRKEYNEFLENKETN